MGFNKLWVVLFVALLSSVSSHLCYFHSPSSSIFQTIDIIIKSNAKKTKVVVFIYVTCNLLFHICVVLIYITFKWMFLFMFLTSDFSDWSLGSPTLQPVGVVPIGSFEVVTLAQSMFIDLLIHWLSVRALQNHLLSITCTYNVCVCVCVCVCIAFFHPF